MRVHELRCNRVIAESVQNADGSVELTSSRLATLASLGDTGATGAELDQCDVSAVTGTMSPSTVMDSTLAVYNVTTHRTGNIIKTTMYIDLTGAKSTTTDDDIIGDTGAGHIGQVTAAVNGAIYAGQVSCAEVPTTGADDINLASSTVATGAYDADVTGLAGAKALMTAGGAHAIGTVKPFTALPAADDYLYLSCGEAGTVGTYDAGVLVIEMWGLAS
jgi:hypothetical protein